MIIRELTISSRVILNTTFDRVSLGVEECEVGVRRRAQANVAICRSSLRQMTVMPATVLGWELVRCFVF